MPVVEPRPGYDAYEYAIIRVVPRVEREEFINAGVVVSCQAQQFLQARVELDPGRLAFWLPGLDLQLLQAHLQSFVRICAGGADSGPIGQLPQRARFHWLTARRSSMLQTSPVHSGRCVDPQRVLEHLLGCMVRRPR